MPEQLGDKSHEATPHRRQQAREQGQVAKSQDLSSSLLLLGALLGMLFLGGAVVDLLGGMSQEHLGGQAWLTADKDFVVNKLHNIIWSLARVMLPVFGVMFVVAVLSNLLQFGFLFLPQKLALDPSRISPLKGFGRIFSLGNFVRLGFGVFKIAVIMAVAFWSLWDQRDQIMVLGALTVSQIATFVVSITIWTCIKIGVALLVLAIMDFVFQRWKHERDMRMTAQEMREEMKTLQGDPQVIARRRAVQRQLILNRLSSAVPEADVVVTNPTELAVALKYDPDTMPAPVVVAKGAGVIAQRIRRLALENGIPIVERKPLAQFLYANIDVNQSVPTEQYAAVAEVLRYVYELKGETPASLRPAA